MSHRLHLALRTLVCFCLVFVPFQGLDQWFYDRFFQLRGTLSHFSPIVLVEVSPYRDTEIFLDPKITDAPVAEMTKDHQIWLDPKFRGLIQRIQADAPKVIAIASYYDVVRAADETPWDKRSILFSAVLNEEGRLLPPPSSLTRRDNYGFCNLFPDSDNRVRRTYLTHQTGTSLALAIAHRLQLPQPEHTEIPLWIDFRGPKNSYPLYDSDTLIQNTKPGTFEGKTVLIGRHSQGVGGSFDTPFGPMSRLEIQANIVDTLLQNREILLLPRWANALLSAFVVLVCIVVLLRSPLHVAWLLLVAVAVSVASVSLVLFSQAKLWLGIANPLFCIFGTHIIILGYKLRRNEENQWQLAQQTQYLVEVDQFKNNFLSLFSHDLKTPIAKIRAIVGRLLTERPDLPQPVQDDLKSLDRTNDELARLISDILRVTKMESMKIEPLREVLDLNRIVQKAVQSLRFFAEQQQVELVLDLEPLFSLEGDPQLIQEVVTNLVENAIKYSHPRSQVLIRTLEEENRVWVKVKDEGPGIPASELPRVTSKFYRGKDASLRTKGTGLGLYLSRYFVELHGGAMTIESKLSEGTEVSFYLPINT